MYYVYYKSYSDGYLFKLSRWDEEVREAIRRVTTLTDNDILFVWDKEPLTMNMLFEDMYDRCSMLEFDIEYPLNDEERIEDEKMLRVLLEVIKC